MLFLAWSGATNTVSLGSAKGFLRKPCRFPEQIVCVWTTRKETFPPSQVCRKTILRSMLDRAYAQTCVETKKLVGAWNCRQCTYMCMCVFLHGSMRMTSERVRVRVSLASGFSFACVSSVRIRRVLCGVCRRAVSD